MLTHQENDKTDEENDTGNYITTNDRERASEFLKNRREKNSKSVIISCSSCCLVGLVKAT